MQSLKQIIVVGSSNTDMVIKTGSFPKPGETLLGGEFFLFPGGKGANQAVAAARLGGRVTFIARIGYDVFGEKTQAQFRNEGIATEYIHVDSKHPSGVATAGAPRLLEHLYEAGNDLRAGGGGLSGASRSQNAGYHKVH